MDVVDNSEVLLCFVLDRSAETNADSELLANWSTLELTTLEERLAKLVSNVLIVLLCCKVAIVVNVELILFRLDIVISVRLVVATGNKPVIVVLPDIEDNGLENTDELSMSSWVNDDAVVDARIGCVG